MGTVATMATEKVIELQPPQTSYVEVRLAHNDECLKAYKRVLCGQNFPRCVEAEQDPLTWSGDDGSGVPNAQSLGLCRSACISFRSQCRFPEDIHLDPDSLTTGYDDEADAKAKVVKEFKFSKCKETFPTEAESDTVLPELDDLVKAELSGHKLDVECTGLAAGAALFWLAS